MNSQVVPTSAAERAPRPIRWPLFLAFALAVTLALALALNQWVTTKTQFGIDFYVYWKAGQAVFFERTNPYTPEFTLATQQGLYGRPALPGEDVKGFAYPPYSLLAVLPALSGSYPWGLALWMAVNLVVLMTAVQFAFPGRPAWQKVTVLAFYPVAYGLVMGQFSVLLLGSSLIIIAILASRREDQPLTGLLSGVLLAWMTVKPQMSWPLIVFFLLVAWRDNRRWTLLGFLGGGVGLLALSAWLVPGWFAPWLRQVLAGTDESLMAEPLALTYGRWIAPQGGANAAALLLAALFLAVLVWLVRLWRRDQVPTNSLLAWSVACALLVHPLLMSPDQALMVLPLLGAGRIVDRSSAQPRSWPWVVAIFLPWILLLIPLRGWNSFAVTKLPPTLFIVWAVAAVWGQRLSTKDRTHLRNA